MLSLFQCVCVCLCVFKCKCRSVIVEVSVFKGFSGKTLRNAFGKNLCTLSFLSSHPNRHPRHRAGPDNGVAEPRAGPLAAPPGPPDVRALPGPRGARGAARPRRGRGAKHAEHTEHRSNAEDAMVVG